MAVKLPETVELGSLTLTRQRDYYDNKPSNVWSCKEGTLKGGFKHYVLTRHGPTSWSFDGGPLEVPFYKAPRAETPELAYIASLKYQRERLKKQYEEDLAALEDALDEVLP